MLDEITLTDCSIDPLFGGHVGRWAWFYTPGPAPFFLLRPSASLHVHPRKLFLLQTVTAIFGIVTLPQNEAARS